VQNDNDLNCLARLLEITLVLTGLLFLGYNTPMNKQDYKQACKAIEAHNPQAYSICQHDNNSFSAKIGYMMAYYVIIDNQIVGDVWYE
jgi:hypothetical protein